MKRKTFKRDKYFFNYKIQHLIGQGLYSDVYFVTEKNTNRRYALKVEQKIEGFQSLLENEIKIYHILKDSSLLFPRIINSGSTNKYQYMVNYCLGPSLTAVRKLLPDRRYTISTGLRLGIEMLRCIEDLHKYGIIHRDIKPSNFLIKASRANPISLIDFGLAKSYLDEEGGQHYEPREKAGFVGTPKYASLNSHECHDLSRRDDLISWWYSLVEILNGSLPWGDLMEKREIYQMKLTCDYDKICSYLPKEILSIRRCILQYSFDSKPNYSLLTSFLVVAMCQTQSTFDDSFDWEYLIAREKEHLSAVSFDPPEGDEPTIPINLVPPVVPGEEEYIDDEKEEATRKCCHIF